MFKMSELINKYKSIIERYKNCEFGTEPLTLNEILSKVDETELLEKMNIDELQILLNSSSGMLKQLFSNLISKKMKSEK